MQPELAVGDALPVAGHHPTAPIPAGVPSRAGGQQPGAERVPKLVVIASPHKARADQLAGKLREHGLVVYVLRTTDGCLRVATAVGPDAVLLDPDFPPRVEQLLRAHPISGAALIARFRASDECPCLTDPLPAAIAPSQRWGAASLAYWFRRLRHRAAVTLGRGAWVALVARGLLLRRSSR